MSFFLFALVILGNTTYGMSVLLKNPDEGQGESSYMIHHLPWLIGSLGTLSLDLIVSFKEQKMWLLWPGPSLIPCTCYILASADLVERTSHHMGFGLMTKENTICGNTICISQVQTPTGKLNVKASLASRGRRASLCSPHKWCTEASCSVLFSVSVYTRQKYKRKDFSERMHNQFGSFSAHSPPLLSVI